MIRRMFSWDIMGPEIMVWSMAGTSTSPLRRAPHPSQLNTTTPYSGALLIADADRKHAPEVRHFTGPGEDDALRRGNVAHSASQVSAQL
ncbi:hypothetical protein AB0B50_30765 [Streptomyces sp. NPDC041068]|uniref:hypothetical protein n=1 Tax=Streptomyces sp. NPDC041068 TaxID=3155130 RepID=UPI0033E0B9D9